jgi:hypothetical protein
MVFLAGAASVLAIPAVALGQVDLPAVPKTPVTPQVNPPPLPQVKPPVPLPEVRLPELPQLPSAPKAPASSPPASQAPSTSAPSNGGSSGGSTSAPSGGSPSSRGSGSESGSSRSNANAGAAGSARAKKSSGKGSGRVLAAPGEEDAAVSDDAATSSTPSVDPQAAAVETDTGAEGSPFLPFTGSNIVTLLWLGVLGLLAGVGLRTAAGRRLLRRA